MNFVKVDFKRSKLSICSALNEKVQKYFADRVCLLFPVSLMNYGILSQILSHPKEAMNQASTGKAKYTVGLIPSIEGTEIWIFEDALKSELLRATGMQFIEEVLKLNSDEMNTILPFLECEAPGEITRKLHTNPNLTEQSNCYHFLRESRSLLGEGSNDSP